jgi:hypothetical protein
VVVGAGGTILRSCGHTAVNPISTDAGTFETSPVFQDLYGIAANKSPARNWTPYPTTAPDTTTTFVAVGSAGTIIRNTRSYYTTGANVGAVVGGTTTWTLAGTGLVLITLSGSTRRFGIQITLVAIVIHLLGSILGDKNE